MQRTTNTKKMSVQKNTDPQELRDKNKNKNNNNEQISSAKWPQRSCNSGNSIISGIR